MAAEQAAKGLPVSRTWQQREYWMRSSSWAEMTGSTCQVGDSGASRECLGRMDFHYRDPPW